jgi:hypothetical protein
MEVVPASLSGPELVRHAILGFIGREDLVRYLDALPPMCHSLLGLQFVMCLWYNLAGCSGAKHPVDLFSEHPVPDLPENLVSVEEELMAGLTAADPVGKKYPGGGKRRTKYNILDTIEIVIKFKDDDKVHLVMVTMLHKQRDPDEHWTLHVAKPGRDKEVHYKPDRCSHNPIIHWTGSEPWSLRW